VRDSQSPIDEGNVAILLLFAIRIWRCFSDPISIGKLSSLLFAIRSSRREVSEPKVDGKLTSLQDKKKENNHIILFPCVPKICMLEIMLDNIAEINHGISPLCI